MNHLAILLHIENIWKQKCSDSQKNVLTCRGNNRQYKKQYKNNRL